jgi:putative ABC transport system substrate-binding protein
MLDMNRRQFITLLGGAAVAWPVAAQAQQQPDRVRVIGYIVASTTDQSEGRSRSAAFLQQLGRLGWRDGHNVRIEQRWGIRSPRQVKDTVAEIVALTPDVILSEGSTISQELLNRTRSIPIVFVAASDPVGSRLVASMSRPGANLTGFTNFEFSIGAKWLEMLREVSPRVKRVLVLRGGDVGNQGFFDAIREAAPSLDVELIAVMIRGSADIEHAIADFAQQPQGGLIVLPGQTRSENSDLIVALAERHRLPAMYSVQSFVNSGGLMSYHSDVVDLYRKAASYIDRILKGEKPADLPVQAPTKYELVINLKTAKALGLEVPPTLLARADEVIE